MLMNKALPYFCH